ncbi:MAG: response regulator [Hahellaceae bacterium]|nr:response regulator [Hahellaceae bacterium]MCP5212289.1 response regulator [Hahellaceae bacterium]
MTIIALVDDEPNILKALQRVLMKELWEIRTYSNPIEALEDRDIHSVDLVLSDYRMPEMNGVEFLSEFRKLNPTAIRLILSGQADMTGLLTAINQAEVYRFITKPWDNEELVITLKQALEVNFLRQENERLAQTVRKQSQQLRSQLSELKRLEKESPGITQVDWNDDGSISLNMDDYAD